MKYIDLIDKLSEEDKQTIENYIYTYGIKKENFVGLYDWLSSWSHTNQKLYRLLGNNFIVKIPIEYEKNKRETLRELHVMFYNSKFIESYQNFLATWIDGNVDAATERGFHHLLHSEILYDNETYESIKIPKTEKKKSLQIPAGTKPMKAFSKIIDYYSDVYTFEGFEDFRIKHSIILTDLHIKTNLCLSIHPMDFMTMSDNNSKWSSCMSWSDDGCYKIGTVEMMNSNNVICCYLESPSHPFVFDPHVEYGTWNNKTYRVLCYITPDIIMSGKSYPYANGNIAQIIIEKVKELAEKNLNWHYQYGPELYQDMQYINSCYTMDRARYYREQDSKKFNIIWDTKGMYNDMLNDHTTEYWCYRNKPRHAKIISVSGRTHCLCCGGSVIEEDSCWAEIYNERFIGVGNLICEKCRSNEEVESYCTVCGKTSYTQNFIHMRYKGLDTKHNPPSSEICPDCYSSFLHACPCCGKPFISKGKEVAILGAIKPIRFVNRTFKLWDAPILGGNFSTVEAGDEETKDKLEKLYVCSECEEELAKSGIKIGIEKTTRKYYVLPINKYEHCRWRSLKPYTEETNIYY